MGAPLLGASEMAQQSKAVVTNGDILSSSSSSHRGEAEKQFKLSFDVHMCCGMFTGKHNKSIKFLGLFVEIVCY